MDSDEITERDIVEMQDMICEQGLLQWPVVDKGNRPRRLSAFLGLAKNRKRTARYLSAVVSHGVPVIAMLEIDWTPIPCG